MSKLTDEVFLAFSRGVNPAELARVDTPFTDTNDMAGNLLIIYALVVGMKAKFCLELGVNDGTSTLAFLKGLNETDGHLTSIDCAPCPTARALVEYYGYGKRWEFLQMDTQKYEEMTQRLRRDYDVLLVDASHLFFDSLNDVKNCGTLVKRGGFLLFHDCKFENDGGVDGCMHTADLLLDGKLDDWQGIMLPFSSQLGVFRRKDEMLTVNEMGNG